MRAGYQLLIVRAPIQVSNTPAVVAPKPEQRFERGYIPDDYIRIEPARRETLAIVGKFELPHLTLVSIKNLDRFKREVVLVALMVRVK